MTKPNFATGVGCIAILLWSVGALITTTFKNLPSYEIISITLGSASLTLFATIAWQGKWDVFEKAELFPILLATCAITGLQYFYNEAFKYAPALDADLINYLWPIHLLLLSTILPNERLRMNQLLGAILAFLGIMVLLITTTAHSLPGANYVYGCFAALLDGLLWASYMIITRYFKRNPYEMTAVYFGLGALFTLTLHFKYETYVAPTYTQSAGLLTMGVFVIGSAYTLWTYGIKYGNYKLMSVIAYLTPILSVGFLALFRKATLSSSMMLACLLVTLGGTLTSLKPQTMSLISESLKPTLITN